LFNKAVHTIKQAKPAVLFCLITASVMCSGCSQSNSDSPQKVYGADSNYFVGLREIADGNEKEAAALFKKCAEKGSYYAARRSAEELTKLGDVQNRIAACSKLLSKYNDRDAVLIAAREYESDGEYSKIIVMTDDVDVTTDDDELVRIRLDAMFRRNDRRFEDAAYLWYTSRAFSEEMYKLYCSTITDDSQTGNELSDNTVDVKTARKRIINFRIDVNRRSYHTAYSKVPEIKKLTGVSGIVPLTAQIVSDMGKACLYGSENNLQNARIFNEIAGSADKAGNGIIYNAWFYAGRLYDKIDNNYSTTVSRLEKAMGAAQTDSQYDNALWYLLNCSLRSSTDDTIHVLEKYCGTWHDPAYFDDFFEMLMPLMLSDARWSDFRNVYKMVDGHASDEVTAKFAYIYGRLVQEKLAVPGEPDKEEQEAFTRALSSGTDTYYKILAAGQLGLDDEATEKVLCSTEINKTFKQNSDFEQLLTGYAAFGLPEKIYPEWSALRNGKNIPISLDCAVRLSDFLNKTAGGTDDYYVQSLRIIARTAANSDKPLTKEALRLLYPCNYSDIVTAMCQKYGLSEETLYALIRSESFFDNDVVSTAGAVGLTQLMEFTAGDIAHRLKKDDYSLKDPATNIEFGTYYLSNLIKRLDGSVLTAFFSYNAGITRVRRWLQSSAIELGNRKSQPYDLFLETIPYSETREYGRKLVSGSAVYGWLYYDKSIHDVVDEIIR
jgi:soluble lytic murein transglycosylase